MPTSPGARAAVILNALDQFGDSRTRDLRREVDFWADWGYAASQLDLREWFAAPPGALADHLAGIHAVWALGGNAFVLARAMVTSGFVLAVREQRHRADFLYGGFSAGACVAGPDLAGIQLMDDPDILPPGYVPVPPETLALQPLRIVPHWRSAHPEAATAEQAVRYLAEQGLPHVALTDGQALCSDGTRTWVEDLRRDSE